MENKKKKIFSIPVEWTVWSKIQVEATSIEEALEKVRNDDLPLPTDPEYIDGTFKIAGEDEYNNDEDLIGYLKDIYDLSGGISGEDLIEFGDIETLCQVSEQYKRYLEMEIPLKKGFFGETTCREMARSLMKYFEENYINKGEEIRNLITMSDGNVFLLMEKELQSYAFDYTDVDEIILHIEEMIDTWIH